ncbi:MAG: MutS-related protein [Candidatus Freyarchaeota archaeon]
MEEFLTEDVKVKLSDVEGVGERIKRRLIDFFGSEEEALNAILEGRIAEIGNVPGIGIGKAYTIVRRARELVEGVRWDEVLKTEGIKRIYEDTLKLIQEYAQTDYAKHKLRLLWPYPASKIEKALERLRAFSEAKNMIEGSDDAAINRVLSALRRVRPLRKGELKGKIKGRAVITRDEDEYKRLKDAGVDRYCTTFLISEGERLIDYAEGYDLVIYVGEGVDEYAENLVTAPRKWSVEDVVPEAAIWFYSANYDVINAVCELSSAISLLPEVESLKDLVEKLDRNTLDRVRELLSYITEKGEVAEGVNQELDRYRVALRGLNEAVAEVEAWVNEEIRGRLAESEARLRGEQIIRILEEASSSAFEAGRLRSYLPPEVNDVIFSTINEAEKKFYQSLGLSEKEVLWLEGLFPDEPALPVSMNPRKISELETWLRRQQALRSYRVLREVARELSGYRRKVEEAVYTALEFDLYFAVGCFARDYELNTPRIVEGAGVFFKKGKNLFLKRMELEGKERVVPVNYVIGDVGARPEGTNGERVVILSGANSGGKTTLIQLIAQVCLLAQMGLPVPAEEAIVGPFEEIYFFEKAAGMLSAGALETTLKRFAAIASNPTPKLALFDEIEAMTESGAAAVIIAGLLDLLEAQKDTCVVVISHLAKEIVSLTEGRVRVDGIAASGLDENFNLIVDRNPRFNYLARSTPELILKKLYQLSGGEEKKVFGEILKKLESSPFR